MQKAKSASVLRPSVLDRESVTSIAGRALARVAARNSRGSARLDAEFLLRLHDASISRSTESCMHVAEAMLDRGIRAEDIADRYIPATARKLGEEWSDDDVSFSLVSIGTARLQAVLRFLGPEWSADSAANPMVSNASALVVVPAGVHHTLGAIILSGQLRRAGLSVRVTVGATTDEVVRQIHEGAFQAVLVSASVAEPVAALRELVDRIRSSIVPTPPIVIGGTVLEQSGDIQALTGADLTTVDVREALEFCDLLSRTTNIAAILRSD